jgi:predicted phage tail protein
MNREVRVYGPLAKFVGQRRFLAEINSAGEAVRMLLANFPGLERHMADQHYKVIVDGCEAELEQLNHPASQCIKIVPVLGGAGGNPVTNIIAGVALVALAIVNPFGAAAIGTFGGAAIGVSTAVGVIGATLVLGGVSQLLSPTPQIGQIGPASMSPGGLRTTTTEGSEMDPQESYSFSGIQNTSRQGLPVPLVYGETIVGSVVISAGIDTDDI